VAVGTDVVESLRAKFEAVLPHLDERQQRLVLAAEARALGHGGIAAVARASGASRSRISQGSAELETGDEPLGRVRRRGGGRKALSVTDPGLVAALLALVEPTRRGDPCSPLCWTTLSTRNLAAELTAAGHRVGSDTVAKLLGEQGFSLQANAKTVEGGQHPDRNAQFGYLNGQARANSDIYLHQLFNEAKSGRNTVRRFDPRDESVAPVRIAFITTGLTASASEIVINSLAPWAEVAIVGEDTLGKPVGQSAFDASGCDLRLRLVAFRFTNSEDSGDYYDGLASNLPFACRAGDDLALRPGDPAEASTSEALAWLGTGACGEVLPPGSRALKPFGGRRIPRARHPAAAESYLPGII